MRNLKRVLSLALASVMLVGMMVVGTSAAGYADVKAEDNVEAIEVLQAAGIMVGDNGSFNPDQNVTRNEMAVVMSNLMNYRVATYANTSPFVDVPSWAEPYVAACYANGITSGMSPTTYGGSGNVTTAQAALMLMKALGYFQYQSDFKDDWMLATTRQASNIKLFADVESGVREPMTRNDLAQLVLNTLEATMVEPDDNILDVSTPEISVNYGSITYFYRVDHTSDPDYTAIGKATKTASGINGTYGTTIELGEELYGGNLKKDDARDPYGRPATRWMYGLNEVGYYPDEPLATYNKKVSTGELYTLVGKEVLDDISRNNGRNANEYEFTVYADGVTNRPATNLVSGVYGSSFDTVRPFFFSDNRNTSAAAGTGKTNAVAGKGVQTEVYLDNDGNLDIVFINTYLMKATDDFNATKGTLNVEILTDPTGTTTNSGNNITATQLNEDDFDLAGYKEDDYILYTISGDNIQDIYPAQVVTGEVTEYSLTNSVSLDGTKYEYAYRIDGMETASGADDWDDSANTEYRVGDVAAVVVDQFGYVLYVDSAAISLGNYLYIDAAVKASGLGTNVLAKAYFTDGTKSEITLDDISKWDGSSYAVDNSDKASLPTVETDPGSDTLNGWYSYSIGSDGKYSIREAKTGASEAVSASNVLEGDKVNFAGNLLGNANTVLIVDDGDDVHVYTGVRNFPKISGGAFSVEYFVEKDDSSKSYVAAAFVDASGAGIVVEDGTADNILYVLNQDTTYVDTSKNETIIVYNAIVGGEETTIKVKAANALSLYTFYSRWSVDADGYYKSNGTGSSKGTYVNRTLGYGETVKVSGSSLRIANGIDVYTYVVTEDTEIVVILRPDATRGGCATADVNRLKDEMINSAATYEVKNNMTGKRLNSLLGDYTSVYGKVDLFIAESSTRVLDTLYVTVYGLGPKA